MVSGDPELDRIDGVLEKLIRVQHPDLVKPDTPIRTEPPLLVTIAAEEVEREPGFVDITDNSARDSLHENAIPAEISSDQTIIAGSSVELRLTQAVKIQGHAVPKEQLVRGIAALNGERLTISINSIRVGQTILPVALLAYDLDGLAGIRIPGAIIRDASKESADHAINSVATTSVDPTLGGQAANAGLQFARSLATKKVRLVQVAVPAGYQVLLKNIRR
jgi:conjugative transposon TraM protein